MQCNSAVQGCYGSVTPPVHEVPCTRENRDNPPPFPLPLTSQVVCTLGPVSRSVEVIEELLRAGMSVARFNFSHGSHDYHQVPHHTPPHAAADGAKGHSSEHS